MIDIIICIFGSIFLLIPIIIGGTHIVLWFLDYDKEPLWWHYAIFPISLLIVCAIMPLIMFYVGTTVLDGLR